MKLITCCCCCFIDIGVKFIGGLDIMVLICEPIILAMAVKNFDLLPAYLRTYFWLMLALWLLTYVPRVVSFIVC